MKRIIMVVTIFIVLGIISITVFYFVKPSIFLYNNTNKIIYVYSSESTYGVEPNEKEVEEIIKMKPDVIDPGETLKLAPSILSLLKKNIRKDTGWRIGGRYSFNSAGGGGQAFMLTRASGVCSVLITINDNKSELEEIEKSYCYKKIKPFKDSYPNG